MAVPVVVSLLLAVAVVGTALAVAPTRTHRPRCVAHGSETIAANRSVRVYSFPPYAEGVPTRRTLDAYACLFTNGSTVRIVKHQRSAHHGLLARLTSVSLAGTTVAYAESQYGIDSGCTGITAINLARRRTVLTIPVVACFVDAGFVRAGQVTSLIVNEHGSVAWVVSKGRRGHESFEVHSASASSHPLLLDEGAQIAPGSLRLSPGGEVSWLDAGRTLYAALT